MKKLVCSSLVLFLYGCSSAPNLPDPWVLGTVVKEQNYFYCESCPRATKLSKQIYQPLEPDESTVAILPIVESVPLSIMNKKRRVNKYKRHKYHKKVTNKSKQCIQWGY